MKLRKESGAFLTTFLATHNQSTEEGERIRFRIMKRELRRLFWPIA